MHFFVDFACGSGLTAADGALHPFAWAACGARFPCARALASHTRRNLGARVAQRERALSSAVHQATLSSSGTIMRLARHLCEPRRTRYWSASRADPAGSSNRDLDELATFFLADRARRRVALRKGSSLPASAGPARIAEGKVVGSAPP